ncbi:ParB/RepB/Spo0J family partition protein [Allomesorhizobium alhagi]|uniref:Nuclease n=1 Tax=Mesorhizobium alhagi CCNWXJ12-2 TaxID=1107882 RepID=H0HNL2_9HYPH|nr:ParB N-terminal domain-containing protein [Mesorhizobium alhagi]EHK57665.1 nuclease [Mesorhizobium alhagi CCNWXJ12-2]
MTQILVPLDQLDFGHNANPPINARKTGRLVEIEALAASMTAHGHRVALDVQSIDGKWYVGDGNRRLAALRLRAERGEIAPDEPIKCDDNSESDSNAAGDELSVALNIMREPLHEADQYEVFRDMAERGLGEEQIAARFGIEPIRVRRKLAIGRLAPCILEAWRNGTFDKYHGGADTVRAFTLAPSIEAQERVFEKLLKDGQLWSHTIRNEFGANGNGTASKWLKIIGVDAYTAAGGGIVEDLFGDHHVIQDPALAERLGNEHVEKVMQDLLEQGWSWVARSEDCPNSYSWERLTPGKGQPTKEEKRRIKALEHILNKPGGSIGEEAEEVDAELEKLEAEIEARAWNADQMAISGVKLEVTNWRGIELTYGLVKPQASRKAANDGKPAEKAAPTVSAALTFRLSQQATLATRAALAEEPRVGFVALLAGFLAGSGRSPVKVVQNGFGAVDRYGVRNDDGDRESFADAFLRLSSMKDVDLFRIAAGIAAQAIDMQGHSPFTKGADVLAASITPERITARLAEQFDAKDYFSGVAKPLVLQAIAEAVNEDEARKAGASLKKDELVDFAIKNVVPTGWLPPLLRTAAYAGPAAVQLAEAAE